MPTTYIDDTKVFLKVGEDMRYPPETINPHLVKTEVAGVPNEALKRVFDQLKMTREEFASTIEVRANPHPEHTPAQHDNAIKRAVDVFFQRTGSSWDEAKATAKAELKRVETDLETQANLKEVPAHYSSIVGTFQQFPAEQKMAALDKLVEQQDGPTLAAILNAPLLVTGLEPSQRDAMKAKMLLKVNPQGVALRDALRNALARLEAASIAKIFGAQKLLEGTDRFNKAKANADSLADRTYRRGF